MMQFTATKSLLRNYFYRDFLPSHLTAQQLKAIEFLVLLGDDDLEQSELQRLGVPGVHIHSTEKDLAVFSRQVQRNNRAGQQVNLYLRDLSGLISEYLQSNKRLQVLNLDICGSYLTCIDPVMTQVLRFARRNPRTVIATYSNVGRDRDQLREGLKSLAICHWLAPQATERTVHTLFNRYMAARLSQEVSLNMALRHLFWLRSNLEHTMLSGVVSGVATGMDAAKLLDAFDAVWQQVAVSATSSLVYQQLLDAVDRQKFEPPTTVRMFNLGLREVRLATYAAANGFYHTGWFALYEPTPRVGVQTWLERGLQMLTSEPLLYAGHGASNLSAFAKTGGLQLRSQRVWNGSGLQSKCRRPPIPPTSLGLTALDRELSKRTPESPPPVKSVKVTQNQHDLIRRLAQQGKNTDEIMAQLSDPKPSRRSITAFVANARRVPKNR